MIKTAPIFLCVLNLNATHFSCSCRLPSGQSSFWFWLCALGPATPDTLPCLVHRPDIYCHHLLHHHPQSPNPSTVLQLRPSSLMRADGAVWVVELTTFTGANENDPSSLAGLSPHWPNFIMANYQGRPLLHCCCCCLAPIYMDTWTH